MIGMRHCLYWSVLLVGLSACGDQPTASPSPNPSPTPTMVIVRTTLTDTVSGAVIGSAEHSVPMLPTQLSFSHPGYVTRDTWVHSPDARADLIPQDTFDLDFYRQLARNAFE